MLGPEVLVKDQIFWNLFYFPASKYENEIINFNDTFPSPSQWSKYCHMKLLVMLPNPLNKTSDSFTLWK